MSLFFVFSSEVDALSFDTLFFVVMATAYSLFYIALNRIIKNRSDSSSNVIALRLKLHLLLKQPNHDRLYLELAENTEVNHVYMKYINGSLIKDHIDVSHEVSKLLAIIVPLFVGYYLKASFDGALSIKSLAILVLVIIDVIFLCFEIPRESKLREAELERTIGFIEHHLNP
jgi:hypothetical protein